MEEFRKAYKGKTGSKCFTMPRSVRGIHKSRKNECEQNNVSRQANSTQNLAFASKSKVGLIKTLQNEQEHQIWTRFSNF